MVERTTFLEIRTFATLFLRGKIVSLWYSLLTFFSCGFICDSRSLSLFFSFVSHRHRLETSSFLSFPSSFLLSVYLSSSKREKPKISCDIVNHIHSLEPPGRFLQKDSKTNLWYEIEDSRAREKTSQALREGELSNTFSSFSLTHPSCY